MFKRTNWKHIILLVSVSYPFLIHYWVMTEQYLYAGWYIIFVILILTTQNLYQGHKFLALFLGLLSICIATTLWFNNQLIIFLPPILIPLAMAYVFGKTLIGNQLAFITDMAQKIRMEPLIEREVKYTRTITYLWLTFFILIAIEALALAYFSDMETWSYVTNFVNYILIAVFFIVEYVIRRIVLSEIEHLSFIGFIKKLIYVQRNR